MCFFLPGCKTFSLHASFFLILCEFYTSFFKVLFIPGCKVFPLVLIFWFSVNSRSFAVLLFILTVSKNQLLRIFFCFCAISLYLFSFGNCRLQELLSLCPYILPVCHFPSFCNSFVRVISFPSATSWTIWILQGIFWNFAESFLSPWKPYMPQGQVQDPALPNWKPVKGDQSQHWPVQSWV